MPQLRSAVARFASVSASVFPDGRDLFFMSSRGLPRDRKPARFTVRWFREMHVTPQNGHSDAYWLKADSLMRPKPGSR